jgi:hypothetical protein
LAVSKTVTLSVGVIEKVLDEADIMSCSFSEAVQRLVTLALAIRRDERARAEKESDREVKRILGAKPNE